MNRRLIEMLKQDIACYDASPFTTPHLSRIAQKETELLELLLEKHARPSLPAPGAEECPPTVRNLERHH